MHNNYFQVFTLTYLIALCTYVYVFPVIMSLCDYLSVCLCVNTWQKLTRQEDQKHFLTLFGLNFFATELQ